MSSAELRVFIDITIIEQIQKTAQKILRFVLHPRTKRIQNFKSVVLWRTHLCRISNLLIYIYNVIDYCSQTQAVYDHLWNCSYPINELLHSFLDLFTGVKKYVVYY